MRTVDWFVDFVALNLGVCSRTGDIFNGAAYLKSYCLVTTPQTFAMAMQTCAANGMTLASVDNPATQAALTAAAQAAQPTGDAGFWINGQAGANGENHDRKPRRRLNSRLNQAVRVSDVRPPQECSPSPPKTARPRGVSSASIKVSRHQMHRTNQSSEIANTNVIHFSRTQDESFTH